MVNYLAKFRLDGMVAYMTGGLGLIGTEVTKVMPGHWRRTRTSSVLNLRGKP